jgi:hypothetical protein
MNDTPKAVEEFLRDKLMARSGFERMLMASRSFDAARAMILASFPPGLSEIETKRRLCERLYGDEVDVDAFVESLYAQQKGIDAEQPSNTTDSSSSV